VDPVDVSRSEPLGGDLGRLDGYAYLVAPERAAYLAIMRVFTGTLLTDLSATEVTERLDQTGLDLPLETVADRLDKLSKWGNLLPSPRVVRAASIRDYHRARSRYQLSQRGERVQRQADDLLAGADGAREVSRELLDLVCRGLSELAELSRSPGGVDPQEALERISTLFAQFVEFSHSVRDFYAYLGQVLFRYDLDSNEFSGFKELLLDYVESITEDVTHFAPQIETSLARLWPRIPGVLAAIDSTYEGLGGLAKGKPGVHVTRSRGRDMADWEALRSWFLDEGSDSEVAQLRDATLRALQALLANAKRMIRSSGGELSRRKDLLRLATWFDHSDERRAHDLFVAAFGLYGCRHLGVAGDTEQGSATSWWHSPPVEVPVSLRDRGTRGARGRTATAEDHSAQKEHLRRQAEQEVQRRHAAAAELCGVANRLSAVSLSPSATALLLELLARAMAAAGPRFEETTAEDIDLDIRITVRRAPGHGTVARGRDGNFALDGLTVNVERSPMAQQLEVGRL
jgi:uncharacterized protein (TIGR02677 family)